MTVTPTGAPVWTRTNDHTTYGGNVNKRNYQGEGAVNPQTDVTAQEFCRMVADLEAIGRVAPFATITYTQDDTGTNDPTIDAYNSMAGVAPTAVRNGTGDVTITWLASYSDQYSIAADLHIGNAIAAVNGSTAALATYQLLDPDANSKNEAVRVRCFDSSGVAVADKAVTLTIFTAVP